MGLTAPRAAISFISSIPQAVAVVKAAMCTCDIVHHLPCVANVSALEGWRGPWFDTDTMNEVMAST